MISLTLRVFGPSADVKASLVRWLRDEQRHRIDGPACVWLHNDGDKEHWWYTNGNYQHDRGRGRTKAQGIR